MNCYTYTPAYYHHHRLIPPPPPITATTHNHNHFYFYPSNVSKTDARYLTRNGAGKLRLVAKAASSSGGGGFAVSAEGSRMSFYEVLGVAESETVGEVKKAYKQLARKYHPDVSPPGRVEEYTRRFILVQQAYETLSDPTLRALYDRDLAKGLQFAFSSRRRFHHYDIDQVMEKRNEWKNRWQSQLSELKRRSMCKDGLGGNRISWAARMRKQREMNESPN